jgi:hypothetical protein
VGRSFMSKKFGDSYDQTNNQYQSINGGVNGDQWISNQKLCFFN